MTLYKKGSRGSVVILIQQALHLLPDGIFGNQTEDAVKEFQKEKGLKPDGILGPSTMSKLVPLITKRSKRVIKEIIVHCSATAEGRDFTVEDIRRWHKQQGWSDIGYHYVIGRHGEKWTGRDVDVSGAHCEGHNRNSIGVCYIGGLDASGKKAKDTRTLQQKAVMLSVLTELKRLYPQAKIYGHRDFARKDCPSFDAKKEYLSI